MSLYFAAGKQIFGAVRNQKSLWLLHLIANVTFLLMIYTWLSIPDRTITDLVLSAASGLAIVLLVLWIHGATLRHFHSLHAQQGQGTLRQAFRATLRNLPALLVWAFVLALVLWFLYQWTGYQERASNWTASFLSFRLRQPVSPEVVSRVFHWILLLVAFVLVPLLMLPWGERAATRGFDGFRWKSRKQAGSPVTRTQYCLTCLPLLLVGVIVPYAILSWLPQVEGLYAEASSVAARSVLAYLFAVMVWLLIASALGLRGSAQTQR